MTDADCVFCKIVAGKIPSRKVYEDDDMLAFHDINPVAPVHFMIHGRGSSTGAPLSFVFMRLCPCGKNLGKSMALYKEPTSDIDTRLRVAKAIIDGSHQFAGTISCGRELLESAKNLVIIPDSVITLQSRFFLRIPATFSQLSLRPRQRCLQGAGTAP